MPHTAKSEGKEAEEEGSYGKQPDRSGHKIDTEEYDNQRRADAKDSEDGEGEGGGGGRERSGAFREAPIVEKVLELLLSEGLESDFEGFASKYVDEFREAAEKMDDLDDLEKPEYKLEHTEIYQKYLGIFEKKVAAFIEENNGTVDEFYRQCRTILETDADWDPRRYFIEALLATTEFETFFNMMVGEARIRLLQEKPGGGSISGSGSSSEAKAEAK